jgi:hypothetical protein
MEASRVQNLMGKINIKVDMSKELKFGSKDSLLEKPRRAHVSERQAFVVIMCSID